VHAPHHPPKRTHLHPTSPPLPRWTATSVCTTVDASHPTVHACGGHPWPPMPLSLVVRTCMCGGHEVGEGEEGMEWAPHVTHTFLACVAHVWHGGSHVGRRPLGLRHPTGHRGSWCLTPKRVQPWLFMHTHPPFMGRRVHTPPCMLGTLGAVWGPKAHALEAWARCWGGKRCMGKP
jgi:hypothetical protein